jgi:hypothetical protein
MRGSNTLATAPESHQRHTLNQWIGQPGGFAAHGWSHSAAPDSRSCAGKMGLVSINSAGGAPDWPVPSSNEDKRRKGSKRGLSGATRGIDGKARMHAITRREIRTRKGPRCRRARDGSMTRPSLPAQRRFAFRRALIRGTRERRRNAVEAALGGRVRAKIRQALHTHFAAGARTCMCVADGTFERIESISCGVGDSRPTIPACRPERTKSQ